MDSTFLRFLLHDSRFVRVIHVSIYGLARGAMVNWEGTVTRNDSDSTESMRLQYSPLYVLVSMNPAKVNVPDSLELPDVLPVAPLTRTFIVPSANGKRIPFINCHVEAQTIEYRMPDMGSPPLERMCNAIPQPRKR